MTASPTVTGDISGRVTARRMLSKVPEITIWFWVIKILCTTVGESFADYINTALGVGLVTTAVIFIVVTAVVLAVQMTRRRYLPAIYWLTVVVMSVTGTLLTDILTDQAGVPLWVSSAFFSVVLAVVFSIWFVRERTLSIHSISTVPREAFYWLAVLVTFALGTALGDWTLELTGWGPGFSILLPLALIIIVAALWRFGANPVLAFWIAYILTRPLGANIGDWLALTPAEGGLGLGTFATSLVFLAAILATVIFLSVSKADVIESDTSKPVAVADSHRRRTSLAILGFVAVATIGLLAYTNSLPHASALADEAAGPSCDASAQPLAATEAADAVKTNFPQADRSELRTITSDALASVTSGDQAGAAQHATELETAWDDRQDALNTADCRAWSYVDKQIDPVLKSIRAKTPDAAAEQKSLEALLTTLGAA